MRQICCHCNVLRHLRHQCFFVPDEGTKRHWCPRWHFNRSGSTRLWAVLRTGHVKGLVHWCVSLVCNVPAPSHDQCQTGVVAARLTGAWHLQLAALYKEYQQGISWLKFHAPSSLTACDCMLHHKLIRQTSWYCNHL